MIDCPSCDGYGCEHCSDGRIEIGCPRKETNGMRTLCEAIDLFHSGLAPVAGGSLDQSITFIEAARELKQNEEAIKARWQVNQ
mgnify:CR=1 FL=1